MTPDTFEWHTKYEHFLNVHFFPNKMYVSSYSTELVASVLLENSCMWERQSCRQRLNTLLLDPFPPLPSLRFVHGLEDHEGIQVLQGSLF